MITSNSCLVAPEGFLRIAGVLIVDESIAAFEGQFLKLSEFIELVFKIFTSDVP